MSGCWVYGSGDRSLSTCRSRRTSPKSVRTVSISRRRLAPFPSDLSTQGRLGFDHGPTCSAVVGWDVGDSQCGESARAARVAAQRTVARPVWVRHVRGRSGGAQRIRLQPLQSQVRKHQGQVDEIFHCALDELQIELPDLGPVQALDGKELHSLANGESTYPLPKDKSQEEDTDGRRDRDADWGVKGSRKKKHYWFGYLLHLVVDATYEVPLAFEVTKASTGEQPQAQRLLDQMQERHPELLERCGRMSADKGYDHHKLINRLWQQHQIKPIIAVRNCWQDGEHEEDGVFTKLVSGQDNVIYTFDGQVSCVCPQTGHEHRMAYGGFERDRETLKYRCPALLLGGPPARAWIGACERCGAHPAGRGSAGVHAGGAVQLPVAGLLRRARCGGAGQQPVGGRIRIRASGHPRAGHDAPARHHGDDDHAGDGPGGASAPASLNTCGVWSNPPDRRLSPVTRDTQLPPTTPRDRSALSGPPRHR